MLSKDYDCKLFRGGPNESSRVVKLALSSHTGLEMLK